MDIYIWKKFHIYPYPAYCILYPVSWVYLYFIYVSYSHLVESIKYQKVKFNSFFARLDTFQFRTVMRMVKINNINHEINSNLTVGIQFNCTITDRSLFKPFQARLYWFYYVLFVSEQVSVNMKWVSASFKFQVLNRNWTSIKLSIFLYFHSSQNFPEIVQVTTWYEEFEQLSGVDILTRNQSTSRVTVCLGGCWDIILYYPLFLPKPPFLIFTFPLA